MSRAFVLDYDGLIVDSETPCFRAWAEIYEAHGQRLAEAEWHGAIGHVDNFDPIDDLGRRVGGPLDRQALETRHRERFHALFGGAEPLPGVRDIVRLAQVAGYQLGVASNASTAWVVAGLRRFGLLEAFGAIRGRDRVGRPKPAPDAYLAVLADLGSVPAASIAFEDSEPGLQAAKAAGMTVVAVPSRLTRFGDFSAADAVLASLVEFRLPVAAPGIGATEED